ncbi:MAG: IPTL-CTERM sorting domain-containing protein [Acidobacteriota bacterium]
MNSFLMRRGVLVLFTVMALCGATAAQAQPGFSKSFELGTTGPDTVVALTFTIDNGDSGSAVTDLAFTDTLPAALTIADPPRASSDCTGATLTAPAGGSTITFSDGAVSAFGICTVQVDVTGSAAGTHTNISGDLTSSAGNSGTAMASLTINASLVSFSKVFSPDTISLGGRSTLTFTIDANTESPGFAGLTITDDLPTGVVIAGPANVSTTCEGGVFDAVPGSSVFGYSGADASDAGIPMDGNCTVQVDVIGLALGTSVNSSDFLTYRNNLFQFFTTGRATDVLTVTGGDLTLRKDFTDDPVLPGDTVTLEFTLTNRSRTEAVTGLTFTDDLDATLTGLVATGLPASDVCGAGSTLSGTSTLTLAGGNLPAEGSCTFSVTLQVPAGAAPASYPNTTSTVSGTRGGSPVSGEAASEILVVTDGPTLTKTFLTNPVGAGDTVTLEFTITNNSATATASDFFFTDDLGGFISGVTASSLPAIGFCGAGSFAFTFINSGSLNLQITGGSLAASASCTFSVDLLIPVGTPVGTYLNTTSAITADVGGTFRTGNVATDDLAVVGAPRLQKSFTDDPVDPGDTVTLEFTLTHDEAAPADATAITFTDNLAGVITGLEATGLPASDVCGTGSTLSGTSLLTLSGGTLAPGASCTFSVTLQVPASAIPGAFVNITSSVTATVSGVTAIGGGAQDTLLIGGLTFTKEFTDDPVIPGDLVTLEFTISNGSTLDATNLMFSDNLGATLSGLAVEGALPTAPCGAGSVLGTSGPTVLVFQNGSLTAGTSCTFSITARVPGGAASGFYNNSTSNLSGAIGGGGAFIPPALDVLEVSSTQLSLTKEFTDDPVAPGGTATLEFTLTNLDAANAATGIAFTDDLDAALTGLTAVTLPAAGFCGAGSSIVGSGLLSVAGANLPAGGSCTFSVTVQVPAAVSLGSTATNTTSSVSGTIGGLAVTGDPASDVLLIDFLEFTKSFSGDTAPGRSETLSITIRNLSATSTVSSLSFTDDLDAVLTGLVATGLPLADVCGGGSMISGTSFLTFTGGTLLPGGSCTIPVPVQIPATAAAGTYPNTTSDLFQAGVPVAQPATADLVVNPSPTFAKDFAPNFIGLGQVSQLTLAIGNTASTVSVAMLDFTDNLPAGVAVSTPANASTTCLGGTLTAVAGSGTIAYTGGSVAAGAVCTVTVDVTGTAVGVHVNLTGDLTSDAGNSGTATDTLTVNPQKDFQKAFAPTTIDVGGVSTLTFTIDNGGSTVAATGLAFTDTFPAGMTVATPANASTTCTGGTITAAPGSGSVSYSGGSVAAGATCTLQVDVTSLTPGSNLNTSGNLTSSLGQGGQATSSLQVDYVLPTFAKAFAPQFIGLGQVSTLTFTIDNSNPIAVANLAFVDNLPAGTEVSSPANAATTCTGGTLTAVAGSGTISYSGGTVAASSSCTVTVDITGTAVGVQNNVSGDLTSDAGNSGNATDSVTVNPQKAFSKAFVPATINLGDTSTLTFTIDNSASTVAATGLDFTDVFPTGMTVATPPNASTTCTGGTLTAVQGSGSVSYTGGTVAAGATCTVQVDVTSLTPGANLNVSGNLTSSLGQGETASATLTANYQALTFAKAFAPNPITVGDVSTLTFSIENPNPIAVGTLAFTDVLPTGVVVASPPNAASTCLGTVTATAGSGTIGFSGGTVAASANCTIDVDVTSDTEGLYANTTGDLTSEAGSTGPATDTLSVVEGVMISKAFLGNPVLRGGAIDLEFTITGLAAFATTDIAFTDDLGAVVPGLEAVGLPAADVCGAGSTLAGTAVISLTGGSLAAGGSCTFTVTVLLPPDAAEGTFTNTTSAVTATAAGVGVTGNSASADLEVVYLEFEKVFATGGVIGGFPTMLTFTITNPDANNTVTGITFTDDLDAVIPGMAAIGLPASDVCGAGSLLDGTSLIALTDGTLAPSGSCSFDVEVLVPESTPTGIYTNVTSILDAVVDGVPVSGDPADVAIADLNVNGNVLAIPTLGTWGLLLMVIGLGLFAIRRIRIAA